MLVPASKVKSICTSAEIELVRASRKPDLNLHTPAQLKRLSLRARKLFEKWQDQGRAQARNKSQETGAGSVAERTHLKIQVFADALQSFEARLAKLEAAPSASAVKSKSKAKKKGRVAANRATRAQVRKDLAAKK
ncbi:MAG: hypothetical protein JSS02_01975 [Planctomycetes bacterium]|nr:hypothetical protein [Planctomycetota bacterium]